MSDHPLDKKNECIGDLSEMLSLSWLCPSLSPFQTFGRDAELMSQIMSRSDSALKDLLCLEASGYLKVILIMELGLLR